MAWTMALVGSAGLRSKEGEGAGGANLQMVQRGLVLQFYAAGRLSWVGCAPAAADSTPIQWRWGRGQPTGSSLGVFIIGRNVP